MYSRKESLGAVLLRAATEATVGPVADLLPWREAWLVVTAVRQAAIRICMAKEEAEALEVAVERKK